MRPYAVVDGRTRPSRELGLLSRVTSTGRVPAQRLSPEHAQTLALCTTAATSIVELAAALGLPATVARILVADLIDCRAVTVPDPRTLDLTDHHDLLKALLDGLQRL